MGRRTIAMHIWCSKIVLIPGQLVDVLQDDVAVVMSVSISSFFPNLNSAFVALLVNTGSSIVEVVDECDWQLRSARLATALLLPIGPSGGRGFLLAMACNPQGCSDTEASFWE